MTKILGGGAAAGAGALSQNGACKAGGALFESG
ncbi:hypothetical protein UACE39S_04876 [Ureibacillus acetophenoni]